MNFQDIHVHSIIFPQFLFSTSLHDLNIVHLCTFVHTCVLYYVSSFSLVEAINKYHIVVNEKQQQKQQMLRYKRVYINDRITCIYMYIYLCSYQWWNCAYLHLCSYQWWNRVYLHLSTFMFISMMAARISTCIYIYGNINDGSAYIHMHQHLW